MRHLLLAPALLLLMPAGAALARVDAGDVATSAGISASLYSTFKDDKRIILPVTNFQRSSPAAVPSAAPMWSRRLNRPARTILGCRPTTKSWPGPSCRKMTLWLTIE